MADSNKPNDIPIEGDDDEGIDDLQRVAAELGGDSAGAVVRLLRLEKHGARTGTIIADIDPSEFSVMEVKSKHGGGHYRAKLTAANGRLMRNQAFSLEGRPRIQDEAAAPAPIQAAPAPREADPMIAMMNMQIQMARDQAKETQAMLREFLSAQRSAPPPAPAPSFGPQEMVSLIATLVPLFTQKTASDPMAPFIKGLEMGKEMSGGASGDEESALGVLSKGLDTFGPLIQGIASAPAPQPSTPRGLMRRAATEASPQHQAPVQVQGKPAGPARMTTEQSEVYMLVKMLANASLAAAQAGNEPSNMVAQYGGMVPDKYRAAVSDPDIVNALVKVEPALEPHRGWLDRLRLAFRESYASPLERARDAGINVNYGPPAS